MKELNIADQCMVHRYRYYVMNSPVISDFEYDKLEQDALIISHPNHPIYNPGSDLKESYSEHIIKIANSL